MVVDADHREVAVRDGIVTLTGHAKSYAGKFAAERTGRGLAIAIIVLSAALPVASYAQTVRGDVAAGETLAEQWCSSCHAVEPRPTRADDKAPGFVAIAKMPSTTSMSVQAWLQTPHPRMPEWQLTRKQIDDVDAYILSLKGDTGL